jgi:purine nucleosidase
MTIPVLLDTDIGSDIDDAVALAYLLRQPSCDLLGVTTVSGEPDRRAALARAVCRSAGRGDVPVHAGLAAPLLATPLQPRAPQAEVLGAASFSEFPRPTAVDFLRETIRARPGEITLLAIGPLTNLAVLFALDPALPALLKQLVLMGGMYYSRSVGHTGATGAEWNMRCDPHAAAIVFRANVPRLLAVGLDVTERCRMPSEEVRERFTQAGPPLDFVLTLAEVWFRDKSEMTFHDPLAAAAIFAPELCRTERQRVEVDTSHSRTQGQTFFDPNSTEKPHEIAVSVDAPAFFQHYFDVVTLP